ncbi:MAG: hypothetical protein IT438_04900 [Phycisphaerales bacterium]|nr:hypothetical protein [Phycisphaerales bacterium]
MVRSFGALSALALLTSVSAPALAAPLNLNLARPDITSGFISVTYNATTDVLQATGTAIAIDFDGVNPPDHAITAGTFTLTASVNSAGSLVGGTLTIGGTIPALGAGAPLLTANLTSFGFSSSPLTQIFEFTGSVTGGSQAAAFGPSMGTILFLGGGFNGTFNSNFNNGNFFGQAAADTARIPAPGAGAAAIGLLGLAARRRRR